MIRRPPRYTRTDTLSPYTTLFLSPEDASLDLDGRVKRSLASLPSRERQALLLVSVESFTPAQTAAILGTGTAEVDELIRKARADLSQRTMANILIIEDDAIIALHNAERSEERRVGKEWVSTCKTRGWA